MEDKGNNPVGSGGPSKFWQSSRCRLTSDALMPTSWVKPWRRSETVTLGGR